MKRKLAYILLLCCLLILTGCAEKSRFKEGFIPSKYNKDDIYYKIYNDENVTYKVKVDDILKEKGKEPLYKLSLYDVEDKTFERHLDMKESQYKKYIGEESNCITFSTSTLYLLAPCKDRKELECDAYEYPYFINSLDDAYEPFTKKNMDNEIDDFLNRISITEKEQFKEYDDLKKDNYKTWVVSYSNWVHDTTSVQAGGNLKDAISTYTKYKSVN